MSIPTRQLGSTGEEVSIIGLGGGHIGASSMTHREAIANRRDDVFLMTKVRARP